MLVHEGKLGYTSIESEVDRFLSLPNTTDILAKQSKVYDIMDSGRSYNTILHLLSRIPQNSTNFQRRPNNLGDFCKISVESRTE